MPPCPDWNEDRPGDLSRIIANINGFWPVVEADTIARPAPSLAVALEWHRRIYERILRYMLRWRPRTVEQ